MLRSVVEHRNSRGGSCYTVASGDARDVVEVTCRRGSFGGEEVDVLYDADMRILYKPSEYLYTELRYAPENTRSQAVSALKALLSYGQIMGVDPVAFDKTTAEGYIRFLRGYIGDSASWSFKLSTHRAESTINAYLKFARGYMRHLGAESSPFLLPDIKRYKRGSLREKLSEGYMLSASVPESMEVPDYASLGEYRALLGVVPEGSADKILERLMFEHGLRIGECLGLTLEDLCQQQQRDGSTDYLVRLRDRVSDKRWQRAKTLLFKPQTAEEYSSPAYRERNVGYQDVFISDDLYFEILDYAEREHSAAALKPCYARSAADSVDGRDENHYLFLNSYGAVLTANRWGKRQRGYFRAAGIPVDEGVRKANLNHRLRHGFAMCLTRDLGYDEFIVKTLMRHKSFASTEVYLKATPEDIRSIYKISIGGLHELLLGKEAR